MNEAQKFRGEIRTLVLEGEIDPSRAPLIVDDPLAPERDRLVLEQTYRNLVTNNGRAQMTKLIIGETTTRLAAIGLSTSVIVPAIADATLPNEINRQAISASQSYLTYYQRYVAVFTTSSFGSTGLNGAGLFDAATTGGNMWADASITVSKTSTQTLVADWRIQATT